MAILDRGRSGAILFRVKGGTCLGRNKQLCQEDAEIAAICHIYGWGGALQATAACPAQDIDTGLYSNHLLTTINFWLYFFVWTLQPFLRYCALCRSYNRDHQPKAWCHLGWRSTLKVTVRRGLKNRRSSTGLLNLF